jgi:hypothetical protein
LRLLPRVALTCVTDASGGAVHGATEREASHGASLRVAVSARRRHRHSGHRRRAAAFEQAAFAAAITDLAFGFDAARKEYVGFG